MLKNWKTSLLGFGIGFLNLYASGVNPKNAAMSIGLAALGMLAKDFDVTGGVVPATDEATKRIGGK